ncbi:MAG: hypothetical protein ACOYUZ_05260 [Patescibacteria group bacterium]
MAARKRNRENRNLTAERAAKQAVAQTPAADVLEGVDSAKLDSLRRHLQVESKDRRGQKSLKYKFWLGGSTMEALLACGDDMVVAALIIEALTNNVRLEEDAQATLCGASASLRGTVAEALFAESKRLIGDASEAKQVRAKFMYGLAMRLKHAKTPRVHQPRAESEPPALLDDVVALAIAAKDPIGIAVAIVEARYVDSDVREQLLAHAASLPLVEAEVLAEAIKLAAESKSEKKQMYFGHLADALVRASKKQNEDRETRDAASAAA